MIAQAMLYTVTVGAPIFGAAVLGAGYLRRHGQAERWVWMAALGLSFAVPVGMMTWAPAATVVGTPTAQVALEGGAESAGVLAAAAADAPPPAAPVPIVDVADVDRGLLALWVLFSLTLTGRWVVSSVRLTLARRSWRPATLDGTPVLLTDGAGPAVAGTFRPMVLAPAWVADLPAHARELVLIHEGEHVRAGDPALVALGRLATVVAPWNPFVWLIASRLARAVELDCDRRVLRRQPNVAAYGATLLMISARTSRHFLAAAFAESDVPLRRRILAMTTPPRALRARGVVTALSVGAALLMGTLAVPAPRTSWAAALQTAVSVDAMQGSSAAVPPLRIVADPDREMVLFRRESGELAPGESVPAGRWFPTSADGRTGVIPQPFFPRAAWGIVSPLPPDARIQQLAAVPRILNPQDISEAVDRFYPARLREQGLGGTVGVFFLVEPLGVVQQRRIGQISAYPELDAAALEVARVYRFSPAEAGGEPVPVWVSHAVDFRVE